MEDKYQLNDSKCVATMIPARYTEVLDNLLRNEEAKEAIDQAMSTYPLYETDPNKVREFGTAYKVPTRAELNTKILNYYRFREIGQETFGRWLFELETALKEIMPYYNQLYYSADQDFNPIYNVDYIRNTQRNKSDTNIGSQSSTTNTSMSDSSSNTDYVKNVSSDTPQNQLNISNKQIDTVDYASQANWGKNDSEASSSSNGSSNTNASNSVIGNEKEGIIETTKGNFGVVSAQDLIIKYRETLLNIEQLIINDKRIQELFMLIY